MDSHDHHQPQPFIPVREARLSDFDPIGLVVDWLDACRNRDLASLLDLYANDATVECKCSGLSVNEGRTELESYWRSRLDKLAPTAFGLEEIMPTTDGVLLDYLDNKGGRVRVAFSFSADGKIRRSDCLPVPPAALERAKV